MSSEMLKNIGSKIREFRKTMHLSQNDLSERAQITPAYLSDIENGKANISIEVFLKLVKALQIPAEQFLDTDISPGDEMPYAELSEIFSDCTESERQALISVLRNVKSVIKEKNQ